MKTCLVSSIGCALLLAMAGCPRPEPKSPTIEIDVSQPNPDYNNRLEKAKADSFFENKRIFERTPIHPLRMAGAIAWADSLPDGEYRWGFTRLQPNVDMPKAELQNEIVFSSIVDKNFSAGASYLAFVTASLSAEDKAEVYLEKVFRALGPEFNQEEVQAPIRRFMEDNQKPGREFYYVEAMQYSTLKLKRLKKVTGKVKASYFVGIDGAAYSSDERFMVKELVAVEMIPLDGFKVTPYTNVAARMIRLYASAIPYIVDPNVAAEMIPLYASKAISYIVDPNVAVEMIPLDGFKAIPYTVDPNAVDPNAPPRKAPPPLIAYFDEFPRV